MKDEDKKFLEDTLRKYVTNSSRESLENNIEKGITDETLGYNVKRFFLDSFTNTDIQGREEYLKLAEIINEADPEKAKLYLAETSLKEDDPLYPVQITTNDGQGVEFADNFSGYRLDALGEHTAISKQQAEVLIKSNSISDSMGNLLTMNNVHPVDPMMVRAKIVNQMIGFESEAIEKPFIDSAIEAGNKAFEQLGAEPTTKDIAKTYLFQVSTWDGVTGQSWLYNAENAQQVKDFLDNRKGELKGTEILGIKLATGDDVRPNRSATDVSDSKIEYMSADEMRAIVDSQKNIPDTERKKILAYEKPEKKEQEELENILSDTNKGEKEMSEENTSKAATEETKEEKQKVETLTVKFGKGYVGEPFTAKDGTNYVDIKIPNADREDKSPWKQFVLPEKSVHEDKYNEKLSWAKIPAQSSVTLSQSIKEADGTFSRNTEKIAATDLKKMLDAVCPKEHTQEKSKLNEIKNLGTTSEKSADAPTPKREQER